VKAKIPAPRRQRWAGLTQGQLREILATYGIHEKPVGPNGEMGYLRADFEPVWKAFGIA
jgi:hypothetical protein